VPVNRSRPRTEELDPEKVDVLIVDDDDAFRESLLEWLSQLGLMAIAAPNGAQALVLACDRSPRLILLDLEMPVMTGWQFLDRVRLDRRLSKIPVIVLSAVAGQTPQHSNVRARLEKPLDEKVLLAAIDEVLSCAPARPAQRSERPPTILVIEDDEDTQASVVELLQDQGYQVARANNGQEAEAWLRTGVLPACIVLDLWMPVMDGWTFASRLRQLGGAAIPLVVITAAEPYWGYPVPPTHVVRKPLHSETFVALMHELVVGSRHGEQPALAKTRAR
jgi:CheY-like chemotaxis protein